ADGSSGNEERCSGHGWSPRPRLQSAYRGQMPDEYLDGLSAQERAQMWSEALARPDDSRAILVVHDGEVVGFAAVGPTADAPSTGELHSIRSTSTPIAGGAVTDERFWRGRRLSLPHLAMTKPCCGSCQVMSVLVASM